MSQSSRIAIFAKGKPEYFMPTRPFPNECKTASQAYCVCTEIEVKVPEVALPEWTPDDSGSPSSPAVPAELVKKIILALTHLLRIIDLHDYNAKQEPKGSDALLTVLKAITEVAHIVPS